MKSLPIPTTRTAVEYTPLPQDAKRFRAERQDKIDAMQRDLVALKITARDGKNDSEPSEPAIAAQIAALESVIRAEVADLETDVAALVEKYPTPIVFVLKVPTSVEREQLQSRFVAIGVAPVTQEMMRATLIEELFEQDWGKGSAEENEVEAENIANFLDGVWMREEAHNIIISRWHEQETERVMDESAGAPARPRADLPPKVISVRENARHTLLMDRMMKSSQKLRDLAARASEFSRINAMALVRIHVLAVQNVDLVLEQDPFLKALPEAQGEALRSVVDDRSWEDLVSRIDSMYKLDGGEEKNSVSPLGKPSDRTGSLAPIGDTANSDGSSTISSITPVPADASATTIASSSDSAFDNDHEPPKTEPNNSPMAQA